MDKESIINNYIQIQPTILEKEIKNSKNIQKVKFDVNNANILIVSGDTKHLRFKFDDNINVDINENEVSITEINSKSFCNTGINGVNIAGNNNVFGDIVYGNKTVINGNGIVIGGNANCLNNTIQTNQKVIELTIPNEQKDLTIDILTKNGNVSIKDLVLAKLMLKTTNGNVSISDFNALMTYVQTINGNINVKMLEAFENYVTTLSSLNGRIISSQIDNSFIAGFDMRHHLNLSTINGNVKALFKN